MTQSESKLYSSLPLLGNYKTWAQVDPEALRANWRLLRRALTAEDGSHPRMMAVVKADAYCHGADACTEVLAEEGCDFFAVSCIEEAAALRAVLRRIRKQADILILGFTFPAEVRLLAENDLIQSVYSAEYAYQLEKAAAEVGVRVRIHVKLDTGMNRIGIPAQTEEDTVSAAEWICRIASLPHLLAEGMFTHFAKADEDAEPPETAISDFTRLQYERFSEVKRRLLAAGTPISCFHVCNSAAALRAPAYRESCVRLGIALWGVYPSGLFDASRTCGEALRPVMRLMTRVIHLHTLLPGQTVSYGGHFSAADRRQIATLPIGYADGFLRAYTGAEVTVCTADGKFPARVVGNVCMDQCMLDVTGIPVSLGDEVILFGDNPARLTALADRAGTIPYECLCRISARIPLIYRRGET